MTTHQASTTVLVFHLDRDRFALPAHQVREIVRAVAIARLPKAPPIVDGVINYRGAVVPVVDPRRRFDYPRRDLHPDQHFIVATARDRIVALRVDRAVQLVSVDGTAIDVSTQRLSGVEYVRGIAKLPDGLVVIHDLDRFLSLQEAEQLDAALGAGPPRATPTLRGAKAR